MKLKKHTLCVLSTLLFSSGVFAAELHPALKHTAEQYDKGMKAADASVAAQIQVARDGYLAVLGAARKQEERAKRPTGVTAIDTEIAAVKAGPIEGRAPEQLPSDVLIYRDRFIAEMKRAPRSNDSVRKHATESYLKWLSSMEAFAKGKDEGLLNAVLAEKKRVLDAAQKNEPGAK